MSPRETIANLDERLGPVKIGELSISRVELYYMGARLSQSATQTESALLLQPDAALIDAIQFDPLMVENHIQAQTSPDAPDAAALLFELASVRSSSTPPLFDTTPGQVPSESMNKLDKLIDALRKMEALKSQPVAPGKPKWVNTVKSQSMITAGLGMQAYGLYSGVMGIRDGLQKGNYLDVAIAAAEIGGEVTSILVEQGITQTGKEMLRHGDKVLKGFGTTSMGKWLVRGAGLMASVITLPFDIYQAIKAFDAAGKTSGKQAMDHYVAGGMSVASAGLTVAIGAAALAGFSSAGPIGLLACATLILGATIYGAVRQVDDIDDYIELSINERWRSGWFAFTGQDLDTNVLERYQVEQTRTSYTKTLKEQARKLLDGELKPSVEAIVSGHFNVEMQPVKYWKFQWKDGELPYQQVNVPTVAQSDDRIDASNGLDRVSGVITGESGKNKGVYWQLGAGNDQVIGVRDKPNYFSFSTGKKNLTGGTEDDAFMFQASESLKTPATEAMNALHGGAGNDTVSLQGQVHPFDDLAYTGHEIDLTGGISLLKSHADTAPVYYAKMTSIENVETLPGGSSRVVGDRQANRITLNGFDDTATGGGGDDQFRLMGQFNRVDGGPGNDRYFIAVESGSVHIAEDGKDLSIVEFDCPLEAIQGWWVQGTSLKVTVSRGVDAELSPREVFLTDVYAQVEGSRTLRNDALLFMTRDGFTLKPDLPAELLLPGDHEISVIITKQGVPALPPIIFNGGTDVLLPALDDSYFIPRGCNSPVIQLQESHPRASTTLFVDYDADELDTVSAHYHVDSRYVGHFNYLTYSDMRLVLQFSDGTRLTLKHWLKNAPGIPSNVTGTLMSTGVALAHPIILTLRDGSSYRVGAPQMSFYDDHRNPGIREIEGRHALHRRGGRYLFQSPTHEVVRLPAKPQIVKLPERQHTSIYSLQGNASSYEIHPSPGATIQLSSTSAAHRSFWELHTQALDVNLNHDDLRVGKTWLLMDDVRVSLAQVSDGHESLDTVHVMLASGSCYQIDFRSAKARLLSIDAGPSTNALTLEREIKAHEAQDSLATTFLSVGGVRLADGTHGAIFYDTQEHRWVVDTDETREVTSSDLVVGTVAKH
ncbi:hypothetical protein ACJ6X8_12655 [Pseudomonas alvandae]|uniref:hypothetical protein n=1 Tax=Pseudomonas TaxID=286 RepID=UPI00389ACD9F